MNSPLLIVESSKAACPVLWCLTSTEKDGEMERPGENVCNKSGLALEDMKSQDSSKAMQNVVIKKIDLTGL
jgi:hypothetical protein